MLAANEAKPSRERLTLIRIFETLRGRGYEGGYDAVRRYARGWQRDRASTSVGAYVPLSFAPGEAYQFDWSHEIVLLGGTTVTVKVAHVRLCHSRMLFVRAYPRETQEMVFDAHDRAFAFFKGACTRGIYDNMKTAVETIFVGRERAYNRRFLQMCSHYLVDPVACTPASGWEKGQVENQVGLVRERFFAPRVRAKSYEELNAWLLDQCIAGACPRAGAARPVGPGASSSRTARTDDLGDVRGGAGKSGSLCRPLRRVPFGAGRGVEDLPRALRQQPLLGVGACGRAAGGDPRVCRPDRTAAGRTAGGRACPQLRSRPDGVRPLARRAHARLRHDVPVLVRKPGALRNGAPFKDWVLPAALQRIRRKLGGSADGDRQMVKILTAVLSDGLPAREAACQEALRDGVHSADIIINILARRREPAPPVTIMTPDALRLHHAPTADCTRYDSLRRACDGAIRDPDCRGRAEALRHEGSWSLPSGWRSQTRGTRSSPPR